MKPSSSSDSPQLFPLHPGPDFELESQCRKRGLKLVAGVDEVGRGPLAGPVVAACVILDPDNIPPGLNDSKKLTAVKRNVLFNEILHSSTVSIASIGAETIDRINILQATLLAMRHSILALPLPADMVLIDGRDCPHGINCAARPVVRGDSISLSIAAASIVAKVVRDRQMMEMAGRFPAYGFENHKGYGTKLHMAALDDHGPCPLHRRSFSPLRNRPT